MNYFDLTKRKYKKKCADGEVHEFRCQYDADFLTRLMDIVHYYNACIDLEFTFRDIAQDTILLFGGGEDEFPQALNKVLDRIEEKEKEWKKRGGVYADRILILASEYNPTPESLLS